MNDKEQTKMDVEMEGSKLEELREGVSRLTTEVEYLKGLPADITRLRELVESVVSPRISTPASHEAERKLSLGTLGSDPRVKADVDKFKGDPKDWLRFWTQLKVFFALQPSTFKSDAQKIGYIYQRLDGDPLKLVTQCYNKIEYEFTVSNLEAFRIMMESLYADQNLLADAGYEFRAYSQSKGNAEHIRKFETLAIAAGKIPAEEMERFIESLKPELQKNVDYESLRFPTLKTDYYDLKQWLIQKEAIGLRKYGPSTSKFVPRSRPPNEPVAMEIGAISSTIVDSLSDQDKSGWFSWCKAQKRCFGCGTSEHQTSSCPSVSSANKLAGDSYYLSSVNNSSLFLELKLPSGIITALVDTGAQGRLYITRSCLLMHKLRMVPAKTKVRLYSYQKTFVEQVDQTTDSLSFDIGGHRFTDRFMICNQLPASAVIGLDWLSLHGALIDCKERKVEFGKREHDNQESAPSKASLNRLLYSSPTPNNEYYTPVELMKLLSKAAGVTHFDLDPASCQEANTYNVKALKFFTKMDDGLKVPWSGNVYVNPPYRGPSGSIVGQWIRKALSEFDEGRSRSVVMLLRSALNARYFQCVLDRGVLCHLKGRLRFDTPEGPSRWKSRDNHCVWYLGPDAEHFREVMSPWGLINGITNPIAGPVMLQPHRKTHIRGVDIVSPEDLLDVQSDDIIESATIRVISSVGTRDEATTGDSLQHLVEKLPSWLADLAAVFDETRCNRLPSYDNSLAMDLELLPDAVAPKGSIYRLSTAEEAALLKEIQDGLKSGKISPSLAPGGCPVLFARKPNGSLRMCVDYRKLNQVTKSQPAILPLVPEILDAAAGSNRYTKIDLKGAFNLLRMRKGTEKLTSFITKHGLYQYNVIPFGLKNAPGHFQLVMDALFSHLYSRGVRCCIDDIIVFENDEVKHRQLVREVLTVLDENGLIASLPKCLFEVPSVEFLGHVISSDGVAMQAGNLRAIKTLSIPRNVKELQSFLGLTNYYRSFIRNYSQLTLPLTRLLKKDESFRIRKEELEAIERLKSHFNASLLLSSPDPTRQFTLQTDASDFAIAGALHQWDDELKALRPIGFFSRKLTPAEINYPIYDKEFLAIKASLENWRYLLIDTTIPVRIECDHRNLSYFKETRNLSRRQARYLDFLSDYNIEIVYTPGRELVVADPLSREPTFAIREGDSEATVNNAVLLPPDLFKPRADSRKAQLSSLLEAYEEIDLNGELEMVEITPSEAILKNSPQVIAEIAATSAEDEESHLLANPQLANHTNWPIFMLQYLTTKGIPNALPIRYQRLLRKQVKMFHLSRGFLYRKVSLPSGPMSVPYIVPRHRSAKMKELHLVFQHLSSPSIIRSLKARCWWPQMDLDLKRFIEECEPCKLNSSRNEQRVAPAHPLEPPGIPFYRWGLDFIQDLPKNSDGFTQIITCMDYATRFVVAKPVRRRDSKTVAEFLFHEILMKFGAPTEIITDRASCFSAGWLQDYLELQQVHHYPSTPYHPNTNGLVERMHAVLGPMIAKSCENMTQKWPLFVAPAVFALNTRTHTVTGVSPFSLVYGFNPKLPGDTDPPFVFNLKEGEDAVIYTKLELTKLGQHRAAALWRSQRQADKMIENAAKSVSVSDEYYSVGSYVKMKNPNRQKFESLWTGPYIVDRLGPNHCYYLMSAGGVELKNPVNQVHLAPWKSTKELEESNRTESNDAEDER